MEAACYLFPSFFRAALLRFGSRFSGSSGPTRGCASVSAAGLINLPHRVGDLSPILVAISFQGLTLVVVGCGNSPTLRGGFLNSRGGFPSPDVSNIAPASAGLILSLPHCAKTISPVTVGGIQFFFLFPGWFPAISSCLCCSGNFPVRSSTEGGLMSYFSTVSPARFASARPCV